MASAWSKLLSLINGSDVGAKPVTPSAVKDAVANGRPIPTGKPLPVARHYPLPVGMVLPELPGGSSSKYANRYTALVTAAPIGEWVAFSSTWILRSFWEPVPALPPEQLGPKSTGSLFVTFLSYATVRYDGVPYSSWQLLFGAPSKGKFLYDAVIRSPQPWAHPYVLIALPTRKVTAEMKRRNA